MVGWLFVDGGDEGIVLKADVYIEEGEGGSRN